MDKVKFNISQGNLTAEELTQYLSRMQNETTSSVIESDTSRTSAHKAVIIAGAISMAVANAALAENYDKLKFNTASTSYVQYNDLIEGPYNNYLLEISKLIDCKTYTKNDIIKSIISFRSLENNWDGYGAYPLEVLSAQNAIEILQRLSEKTASNINDFFSNPNGTITLVWENQARESVSIEIGNNTFSYYKKLNSMEPVFKNSLKVEGNNISNLQLDINSLFI